MNTTTKMFAAATAIVFGLGLASTFAVQAANHNLTDEVKAQIREAAVAGDFETVRELLAENGVERKNNKRNKNPEVQAAVEAGDFSQLPEDSKLTEEEFNIIVEIKAAKDAGDDETATTLKAELKEIHQAKREAKKANREEVRAAVEAGDYSQLPEGSNITESKFDEMVAHKAEREAIKATVEAGDYAEFQSLVSADSPLSVIDTEAEFARLQDLHEAREADDKETAKVIAEELGIEKPDHGPRRGRGGRR